MLSSLLLVAALAAAPEAAPPPTPAPVAARGSVDCFAASLVVSNLMWLPAAFPLWIGGVAKGLIAFTLVADVMTQAARGGTVRTPPWLTPQLLHLVMIATAATVGAWNLWSNLPGFAVLQAFAIYEIVRRSDGLGTGACRGQTPRRLPASSLLVVPALFAVATIPAPLTTLPMLIGAVLVLTSMGILPAMPWIPALGFVDREFAIKRAGLLTSATYPAYWISSSLVTFGLLYGALWLWSRTDPLTATE